MLDGGETLARQTGLLDARRRPVRGLPNKLTTGSRDELSRRSGAARSSPTASLTDPGRSAALEITCPGNEAAMALVGAAGRLHVPAKAREVRGVHRVVIRDGEAISAMLIHMGAQVAVLRVGGAAAAPRGARDREPPRQLRRRQPAPLGAGRRRGLRTGRARARDSSPTTCQSTCAYAGELRLSFRDASLDELGHHADPPMTKDAVAGRIRRLLAMADKQAADRRDRRHRREPARRTTTPERWGTALRLDAMRAVARSMSAAVN